ncbi:uncharacterized protein LOC119668504 [Teleopsis dalmanni]|uniref:uncharacterized protein LOC119668504 n=1 Tax=Teleopsis dalmanni TaxID=139649 RepID=UPI0018CE2B8B|nr:uncharacterized protein LOC119668504 [Teleopsis dalmanni]
MYLKALFICIIVSYSFWEAECSFGLSSFRSARTSGKVKKSKNITYCDGNQLLLQLANLYIVSPERIVLLLTTESYNDTCEDLRSMLTHINATLSTCVPLPTAKLYLKLRDGSEYFDKHICCNLDTKKKHIVNYHPCLVELRDDLIDCEGPPDWFEQKNKKAVCQDLVDVVNCYYIKAAMLCGKKAAKLLREFSINVLKHVIMCDCHVPSSLPYVCDAMPSEGALMKPISLNYVIIFLLI